MRRASLSILLAVSLTSLSGCPGDDPAECTSPLESGWTPVFYDGTQLDRAVLSAWASGPDDVYLAGGGLGVTGVGALAMHWDGRAFTELPTGKSETLWWVWGAPGAPGAIDVWMVGENGLILRWDGAAMSEVPSGVTSTLYGVWGSSSTDVWIVGGQPGAGMVPANDVVLHWDGQTLTPETITPKGAALFKVWGSAADDMWVVGELGTIWRRTAAGWMDYSDTSLTTYTLFTVHGCSADEVYAVGSGNRILGFDGNAWTRLDAAMLPSQPNGVACGAGTVLVVGGGGLKSRFDKASGVWIDEQSAEPWDTDFHGALVNSDGSLWAVGGNFVAPPDVGGRIGVVGYLGCEAPTP